jgi:methylglutaconyl-CoA hydratase
MTDSRLVHVEPRGPAAVLTLDDPQSGNALSAGLIAELAEALAGAKADVTRAVVLTGAGKHFSAGAHLGELKRLADAAEHLRLDDAARLGALYADVLRCPLVTIAAVRGATFGGGLGLAAACDFVVAAPDARLQFSELRLGFVPALISVFLGRRVAPARLANLFLDPAPLDGVAARAVGLVDEVAPDPLSRALERAVHIAATVAPSAVAATKRLLLELALPDLDERFARAARLNAAQRVDADCRRGVAHFVANRSFPDWLERGSSD